MPRPTGAPTRALIPLSAVAAIAGLLVGAAPAWAHVHVDADNPAPGSTAVLTFRVPGESEKGALTNRLQVTLPDVASARTEVMPGWTAQLDRDTAAGTVRSVTWTAAPGTGISPDQFALFKISVALPTGASVSFPATQTYSDGTVVRWDQPPLADGDEPEYPVPTLALTGSAAGHGMHGDAPPQSTETTGAAGSTGAAPAPEAKADSSARWLAGGALVLSAIAVAVALVSRRRT